MVAAIKPILLSTPCLLIMSVATAIELFPEIGLRRARGIISLGKCIKLRAGEIACVIPSIMPDLLSSEIATNKPIRVGKIFIIIFIPSEAPSKNMSKAFLRSVRAYTRIKKIISGMAALEI